jgi:uncharacterized repeat protein (TIGR03803 family)
VTPVSGQTAWKHTVIYNFCSQPGCTDGATPQGGLTIDAHRHLFGVTVNGGNGGVNGWGTVFEITPSQLNETVLYRFCAETPCTDGQNPEGTPVLDSSGRLIGTTAYGGATGHGTVFRVDPKVLSEVVLWNFCSSPSCTDGAYPVAGPTIGSDGDLFGTTQYGGKYASTDCDGTGFGCGVVYRLHYARFTVLHNFCSGALPNCADGAKPGNGSLLTDSLGNLFGVTPAGGRNGQGPGRSVGGTVFELAP